MVLLNKATNSSWSHGRQESSRLQRDLNWQYYPVSRQMIFELKARFPIPWRVTRITLDNVWLAIAMYIFSNIPAVFICKASHCNCLGTTSDVLRFQTSENGLARLAWLLIFLCIRIAVLLSGSHSQDQNLVILLKLGTRLILPVEWHKGELCNGWRHWYELMDQL